MKTLTEYDKQATKFLQDTNTELSITKYPDNLAPKANWSPVGNAYKITIERNGKNHTFTFWDSYANKVERKRPSEYSVLSCLASDSHYEDYTLDEFAEEFGYTKPSEAIRVYNGVKDQYNGLKKLYSDDEITALQEIQ
jgi:hypothetical protein